MKRKERYKLNKSAKVGEEITCPVCSKNFKKKQYSQAFCCGKCKDDYWNAKGDRHGEGYYENHDLKHTERIRNRILYGSTQTITIKGLTSDDMRKMEERRAELEINLDNYSEKELKRLYENLKYGEHPHLDGQTKELFGCDEY